VVAKRTGDLGRFTGELDRAVVFGVGDLAFGGGDFALAGDFAFGGFVGDLAFGAGEAGLELPGDPDSPDLCISLLLRVMTSSAGPSPSLSDETGTGDEPRGIVTTDRT